MLLRPTPIVRVIFSSYTPLFGGKILPGFPTTVAPSGTSRIITDPAPISAPSPTVVDCNVVELIPKKDFDLSFVKPPQLTPGDTVEKFCNRQLCPIAAFILMITKSSITDSKFIVTPGYIILPFPKVIFSPSQTLG